MSGVRGKKNVLLALGYHLHEFHTGVARYAREADWVLDRRLMFVSVLDPAPLRLLAGERWDGIIAFLAPGTPVLNDLVQTASIPVVDLARNMMQLRVPRVLQHNAAAGEMAAEHFVARGFQRILFYSTLGRPNARERYEGLSRVAHAAGCSTEMLVWQPGDSGVVDGDAARWLASQLARQPLPLAVVAEDDWAALHVLEAAELAGLHVPEQVSVLGIDDDAIVAALARVPLSSVDTGRERIAYEAAAMLDRTMRGELIPTEPVYLRPVRVVTRKSTDVYAVEEPELTAAMAYIRDHLHEPISVDDIADKVGVGKRTLQGLFHDHLRRSISSEVTRLRLERAKSLLCKSDLKIGTIASRCGFGSPQRMSKVFVRVEGESPSGFRRRHHTAPDRPSR